MPRWSRTIVAPGLGALFLVAAVLVDFVGDLQLSGAYATAAIIASISCRPRPTAVLAGLAVLAATLSGFWHQTVGDPEWSLRLISCVVAGTSAVIAAGLADRYRRTVRHTSLLAQDLLDALALELTGARTETKVAEGFMGQAAERLGASSAMIFVLDEGQMMRSIGWLGRGGSQADQYSEFRLDADIPGAVAARTRTPLHYPNRAAIDAAFPGLAGYYPEERSLHVLPLVHREVLVGLLALTFPPSVVATEEERGLLVSLSNALGASLVRARSLAESDAEVQRAAILAEASMTLSRSLDWEETIDEVCRLLVPRMSDWCSLDLLRDGVLRTAAVRHHDPETTQWARGMLDVFPIDMDATTGAPAVVRTGRSELFAYIPEELLEASAVNEEHAAIMKRLGMVSAVVVPLRLEETVLGALSLAYAESGRRYTEDDVELLEGLASRVATALHNAESFTTQSRRLTEVMKVAAAAQLAILAPPPARLGPFALSARYLSAAEEAQIGGDLYEVAHVGDRVRLLIGDVRGKGLTAVRTATVVLGGFRSSAVQGAPLAELARHLDQQVQVYLDDEEDFVTAALVDIDHDGHYSVVLCGHPPPLLASRDGWRLLEAEAGLPLGLGSDPAPSHGVLEHGDRIILFTDGLLEARHADGEFFDPQPLWSRVMAEPFPTLLDTTLETLHEWNEGRLQDDLALLAIEFLGAEPVQSPAPPPQRQSRSFPAEGRSVGAARRVVRSMLAGTRLEAQSDDAVLATSELVTNALVHAGSEIQVVATVSASGLRVEVGDTSPRLPAKRTHAATASTGRGLHLLERLVTRWGALRVGPGKLVWFEIDDPTRPVAELRPPESVLGPAETPEDSARVEADDGLRIELVDVPLAGHAAWQEHASTLLREHLMASLGRDPLMIERHAQASDALNLLFEQVPKHEAAPVRGRSPPRWSPWAWWSRKPRSRTSPR